MRGGRPRGRVGAGRDDARSGRGGGPSRTTRDRLHPCAGGPDRPRRRRRPDRLRRHHLSGDRDRAGGRLAAQSHSRRPRVGAPGRLRNGARLPAPLSPGIAGARADRLREGVREGAGSMLIVDAQVHIWRNNKPTNPAHRQVSDFSQHDLLKEMDDAGVDAAVIHPPGWDPNSNELAVEAAREFPDRLAILGNFPLDRPESRALIDGWTRRPGMRGQLPAARRAGRGATSGSPADRRSPGETLGHQGRGGLGEPSRAPRAREASERGGQGHRRAELLQRALSLSQHPWIPAPDLRRLRSRTDVLGHRHHAHAVRVAAVRDALHGRAAVALRARQGADHGTCPLHVARLEAGDAAMIDKFATVYAGHVDLPDMGQGATPANERRYPNAHLAKVFEKTEAVARAMDDLVYYALWMADTYFHH